MSTCDECKWHRAAMAGPSWDRCKSPNAETTNLVRKNKADDGGDPKCVEMRAFLGVCGLTAALFEEKERLPTTGAAPRTLTYGKVKNNA